MEVGDAKNAIPVVGKSKMTKVPRVEILFHRLGSFFRSPHHLTFYVHYNHALDGLRRSPVVWRCSLDLPTPQASHRGLSGVIFSFSAFRTARARRVERVSECPCMPRTPYNYSGSTSRNLNFLIFGFFGTEIFRYPLSLPWP